MDQFAGRYCNKNVIFGVGAEAILDRTRRWISSAQTHICHSTKLHVTQAPLATPV